MSSHRAQYGRQDWTRRYLHDQHDEDHLQDPGRFSKRSKFAQADKMRRTTEARGEAAADIEALPCGVVTQVYSLFVEIEHEGRSLLATQRSSMRKQQATDVVVGDLVRFRESGITHESGRPEAVIEAVLTRQTVLLRADSFKQIHQHPIVANARQMLVVASIRQPRVKWGLVDRMLIAAQSGGLKPVLCLNKVDLAGDDPALQAELEASLAHYSDLGIPAMQTSVETRRGLEEVAARLTDQTTVLAGHSGVGKSSLIQAIAPNLTLKVNPVSAFNEKGRHTTTSARRLNLPGGGIVIDTPGVRHFGLWNVSSENLGEFFPDVLAETAPAWRCESYQRILSSLST